MIKLEGRGEMLFIQLLNLIDKIPLHQQYYPEWDGKHFSKSIEDYPNPMDVYDSPLQILSKKHHPTSVVPSVILDEISKIIAGDGDLPGLEDYVSGDWRSE